MTDFGSICGRVIKRIGFCRDCQPGADAAEGWDFATFIPGMECEWCHQKKEEFAVKVEAEEKPQPHPLTEGN